MQHSTGVLRLLNNVFSLAVRRAYPSVTVTNLVKHTEHPRFGDYQCSAAMAIASVSSNDHYVYSLKISGNFAI